ncbi:phage tail protein [Niabella hibiscisoli]|uniref:phage tail protein n=1 Tax=Niabella hibiscisoli TaxID=1825928 RepID=UPI001F0D7A43|nr:tail fiber protein [Niabella hibiscisoli]MCH5715922.1 tail fiber protein [Niabella hibiscisoli]
MNPYLGAILQFAFGFAPKGWAPCNGQLLPIAQNQALFSLLGTFYGGNGTTNFALPDLRGRVPIGWGQGLGLPSYDIGQPTGTETVNLSVANMPQHKHLINASSETGDAGSPANTFFANSNVNDNEYKTSGTQVAMNAAMMANAGSGAPVPIMQPYLVVNYCIALQGIYPSRE